MFFFNTGDDRGRWVKLVAKLLELTQKGELRWRALSGDSQNRPPELRVTKFYKTVFQEQSLRLYEYREKSFYEETFEWVRGIRLEFLDNTGEIAFTVPEVEGLPALLDAAQYKTAGIEEFLKKLDIN